MNKALDILAATICVVVAIAAVALLVHLAIRYPLGILRYAAFLSVFWALLRVMNREPTP